MSSSQHFHTIADHVKRHETFANPANPVMKLLKMEGWNRALFIDQAELWGWHDDNNTPVIALKVETDRGPQWLTLSGHLEEGPNSQSAVNGSAKEIADCMGWKDYPSDAEEIIKGHQRAMEVTLGVGMLLKRVPGAPPLDTEQLVSDLWGYSCHPYWGRSIAADLIKTGERATTVVSGMLSYWNNLTQTLENHGITLTRSWPMPSDEKVVPEDEPLPPEPIKAPSDRERPRSPRP